MNSGHKSNEDNTNNSPNLNAFQFDVDFAPVPRLHAMGRIQLIRCLILLCIFWGSYPVFADPVDWPTLGFTQTVAYIFNHPVVITHAEDNSGRMFVVEQSGRIRIVQNNNVLAQPFLDISNRVISTGAEQGLLGLVFPPGFSTNNHFYVDYTRQTDGAIVISRFLLSSTNANVADTNSEQIIKIISKPFPVTTYNNHNGGQLAFGPDGYLYIGVGDGGSETDPQNNGQKTNLLFGKILRIDVESGVSPYAIPPSNPFVNSTGYAPETWSWGLRNPWRFSFDRQTGDLYIGDVGQNLYEEIDFQTAGSAGGQNYGWRIMEGTNKYNVPAGFTNFSGMTLPVAVYSHFALPTDAAGAVVGGYVYRGPNVPRMNGVYFYGDFMAGWIWGLKQTGTNWQNFTLLSPSGPGSHFMLSTFGEDDVGQLYLADYYAGKIYQVQDSLQVWTPTFSPTNGIISSNLVTVSCVTTGAVIHYTSNGIDPTAADPVIASGGMIQVTTGITNKLRAFRADLTASAVATAIFTNKVGTPVFSPPSSAVTNGTPVSISTVTPGATIYYTTNGTTPTTASFLYSQPIEITQGMTLKAFGVESGYSNSVVATAFYSIIQVATPVFNPPSGPITNGTVISISCATTNAIIYYTLDGTMPTTNSIIYTNVLTVRGGTLLTAIAILGGYKDSADANVLYSLVQTETPVFDPPSGPITNGTVVSISCATTDAVIYYTLDGAMPTTNSAIYTGPIVIDGNITLNAFAINDQHLDSAVQSIFYQLAQVSTPIFNPSSGPITNETSISISCATPGATIFYTTNGTIPTSNSSIYKGSLTLTGNQTLECFAANPSYADSSIQSTYYDLWSPENTVVTTLAGTTSSGWLDGPSYLAQFNSPQGICVDSVGNVYVSDTGNNVIRRIGTNGLVTTIAGNGIAGFSEGTGTNAQFNAPMGICIGPSGDLFVADCYNRRIRRVTLSGIVNTFSGNGTGGQVDGAPGTAQFGLLSQMAVDNLGYMYVGDSGNVRQITTNGYVKTFGLNASYVNYSISAAVKPGTNIFAVSGYAYVDELQPGVNEQIYAGSGNGFADGPLLISKFPQVINVNRSITYDTNGNLFISDPTRIRKIRLDGWVSTLAGSGAGGYRNGRGIDTGFSDAAGLVAGLSGNIFVADSANNCIREISPDTYGIGIPDWWQLAHFGHIGINPNADPDHDGMNNYQEFWAGTDPLDANSFFAINSIVITVGSFAQISWQSVSGKTYTVQYSDDLKAWNPLGNSLVGNGSIISVSDTTSTQQATHRMYRVFLVF